jgi:hypothetical protein
MGSGVSLLLMTSFASRYDPEFERPKRGYQQFFEFYVGERGGAERVVDPDRCWLSRTDAPTKRAGPFAAMIEDPDGNVVLVRRTRRPSPIVSLSVRPAATRVVASRPFCETLAVADRLPAPVPECQRA